MFVGTKGLVCNVLSVEWSTDVVFFSEVGGLNRFRLSNYSLDDFACGVMCRRAWPCGFISPPRCSTPVPQSLSVEA